MIQASEEYYLLVNQMLFIILLKKKSSTHSNTTNEYTSEYHLQYSSYEDHLNSSTPQHNVNTINSYYIILGFSFNFTCNYHIYSKFFLQFSRTNVRILTTIGVILVPVSLLCMILVVLTYILMRSSNVIKKHIKMHAFIYIALYRSLWSMRNYIHIMLCVSLLMAQLVFIIGIDKIGNKVLLL